MNDRIDSFVLKFSNNSILDNGMIHERIASIFHQSLSLSPFYFKWSLGERLEYGNSKAPTAFSVVNKYIMRNNSWWFLACKGEKTNKPKPEDVIGAGCFCLFDDELLEESGIGAVGAETGQGYAAGACIDPAFFGKGLVKWVLGEDGDSQNLQKAIGMYRAITMERINIAQMVLPFPSKIWVRTHRNHEKVVSVFNDLGFYQHGDVIDVDQGGVNTPRVFLVRDIQKNSGD